MADRELLELAAKAAGADYEVDRDTGDIEILDQIGGVSGAWEPLEDDGDALRLAVKLRFLVQINEMSVQVECWQSDAGETRIVHESVDPLCDYFAATRRAITRAAAEIGRALP